MILHIYVSAGAVLTLMAMRILNSNGRLIGAGAVPGATKVITRLGHFKAVSALSGTEQFYDDRGRLIVTSALTIT